MNNYIRLLTVTLMLLLSHLMVGQVDTVKIDEIHTEFGLSYPISLTDKKEFFSVYMNFGVDSEIRNKYIVGAHFLGSYDQGHRSDFSAGLGVRLGTKFKKNLLSVNLGYAFISKQYGSFPGPLVGLNFDYLNKFGIHLRYKEMSSMQRDKRKVVELGLHTNSKYTRNYVIPVIGGILVFVKFLTLLVSGN